VCTARGPEGAITVRARRRLDRGPLSLRFEPARESTNIAGERTCGLSGRTHGYLPAKNPPFNLPDCSVVRPAGTTLAEAHLEHPEKADDRIKGVVPVRKAA